MCVGEMSLVYAASFCIEENGVLSGYDLTTEAAVTKTMYALGKSAGNVEAAKAVLKRSVCGEVTL